MKNKNKNTEPDYGISNVPAPRTPGTTAAAAFIQQAEQPRQEELKKALKIELKEKKKPQRQLTTLSISIESSIADSLRRVACYTPGMTVSAAAEEAFAMWLKTQNVPNGEYRVKTGRPTKMAEALRELRKEKQT